MAAADSAALASISSFVVGGGDGREIQTMTTVRAGCSNSLTGVLFVFVSRVVIVRVLMFVEEDRAAMMSIIVRHPQRSNRRPTNRPSLAACTTSSTRFGSARSRRPSTILAHSIICLSTYLSIYAHRPRLGARRKTKMMRDDLILLWNSCSGPL